MEIPWLSLKLYGVKLGVDVKTVVRTSKPSPKTYANLHEFLEQQRDLWNACLEQRISAHKKGFGTLTEYGQYKQLTDLRKSDRTFSKFCVGSQRTAIRKLRKAFQSFFRRVKSGQKPGYPRFKGKNRAIKSFEVPNPVIKDNGRYKFLVVKGIGRFRFKHAGPISTKLARVVVSPRRIKVQFLVETPEPGTEDMRPVLGIDAGVKSQVTLSNGHQVKGRKRNLSQIKKRQRKLSKATRGSNNRAKKKVMLSKAWQKLRDRERGILHELTSSLVRNHGARYYIEDLRIGNMVKNRKLARRILEQNWGLLFNQLKYKAENAGGWVRKVNPANTSQMCSYCSAMPDEKLKLSDRVYVCLSCGIVEDRDVNAARNVLNRGLASVPGGYSDGKSESRCVRRR